MKGVGAHAVEHLVKVRGEKPFADIADFAHRVDPQMINRKALECLVQAGAFDSLDPERAKLFENIGRIAAAAQERSERTASGITDLFGGTGEPARLFMTPADPWPPAERLQREFLAIGTYLSAHPIDDYAALVQSRGGLTWKAFLDQLRQNRQFTARIAATVVQRQERRTRTGGRIGIVTLSDPTAQFEATLYQERLADWRDLLEPGHSVFVQIAGEFDPETEEVRARIQAIEPLEAMAARKAGAIRVFLDAPEPIERLASRLDKGEGTVSVIVMLRGREVEVKLPGQYRVTPQVAGAIKAVPGVVHVELG
jgi:DNA polymerase-3 subunit alpha